MRPYPPLGILYISAWLDREKVQNKIFDTTFSNPDSLHQEIDDYKPDILAIYTNLMTKVNVVRMMKRVKAAYPNIRIVLGGPDLRYNIHNYLDAGADFLVIGEGEQTMSELAKTIELVEKPNFKHINGIAFRDEMGIIHQTPERTKIKSIDELPFPNRAGINLNLYLDAWKEKHGMNAVNVSTQRGCPYTCKWCSTAVYGQSYRRRSPHLVVDEMLQLREQYNPDSIWFVDDVFTVSHKWIKNFADEVEARKAQTPFECITRADRLKEEVILDLKRAGVFRIWIGAESGSQSVIDAMDRRVDVNKVREMIRLTRSHGIQAGTFIMLGYPGETEEDIEETIRHLKESNPDQFTITVAYPIKGTGLYQQVESVMLPKLPWEESTDRQIEFQRTFPRKYYDYAVRRVVNEVNYHKLVLENKQYSKRALALKVKFESAKVAMKWIARGGEVSAMDA